MVRRQM